MTSPSSNARIASGLVFAGAMLAGALGSSAGGALADTGDLNRSTVAQSADSALHACASDWSIRDRVAQTVTIGVNGDGLGGRADELAAQGWGGLIVVRPMEANPQAGMAAVDEAFAIEPLFSVDSEGGAVQTAQAHVGNLSSPRQIARTSTASEARETIAAHGARLAELGFDIVFGPAIDVATDGDEVGLGSRSFGTDPDMVSEYGEAYIAGLRDAGLIPVLKHFPGLGTATGDPHTGAVVSAPIDGLIFRDLGPFDTLVDPDLGVMVSHQLVPDLTNGTPASLSPEAVTGLLREELDHEGLIITDSLSMGAIAPIAAPSIAIRRALMAGSDIALIVTVGEMDTVLDDLVQAVLRDELSIDRVNDAASRVLAAKGLDFCSGAQLLAG